MNPSKRASIWWKDPEWKKWMIERIREGASTPESRKRSSDNMKARWADPVEREKLLAPKRGVPHPQLKLRQFTDDEVRRIRNLVAEGRSQSSVAREYGCPQPIIHYIVKRKTYKDVL